MSPAQPELRGHTGEPDCDCGGCEPADGIGGTVGAVLSGNLACDWPSCSVRGDQCAWGERRCFDE